jgi:membrane associated rhomboid family serine protease
MAVCKTCGAKISSFSFGTEPPSECRDCRRKRKEMGLIPGSASPAPKDITFPALPLPVVTIILIGANVALYLAMGLSGVSWTEPGTLDAIRWGADFGPLTLGGQWWRLFTSTFVHFGIAHVAFNMWCLFGLGQSLEYLMGRKAFTATYLVTGIAGSVASLFWRPWTVGAGASGAIFGIAGAFAAYVYLKKIGAVPDAIKRSGKSLAVFIIYNLARGAAGNGIDNSAHIGGLVAGLILGAIVPPLFHVRATRSAVPGASDPQPAPPLPIEHSAEDDAHSNRVAWTVVLASAVVITIACIGVRSYHLGYAKYGEAVRLVKQGRNDEAIVKLQESTRHGMKLNVAYDYLGELELEQGNPQAALAALQQAMAHGSDDAQTKFNVALANLGSGNPQAALQAVNQVIAAEKHEPDDNAIFVRGIAKAQTGDLAGAIQDLQTIAPDHPEVPELQDALTKYQALSKEPRTSSRIPLPAIPYSSLVSESDAWPIFP